MQGFFYDNAPQPRQQVRHECEFYQDPGNGKGKGIKGAHSFSPLTDEVSSKLSSGIRAVWRGGVGGVALDVYLSARAYTDLVVSVCVPQCEYPCPCPCPRLSTLLARVLV